MATVEELKALMETGKQLAKEHDVLDAKIDETVTKIRTMGAELLQNATPEVKREVMRALFDMVKFGLELRLERQLKESERDQAFELLRNAGKNTGLA